MCCSGSYCKTDSCLVTCFGYMFRSCIQEWKVGDIKQDVTSEKAALEMFWGNILGKWFDKQQNMVWFCDSVGKRSD